MLPLQAVMEKEPYPYAESKDNRDSDEGEEKPKYRSPLIFVFKQMSGLGEKIGDWSHCVLGCCALVSGCVASG